jgi:hypothetical protein
MFISSQTIQKGCQPSQGGPPWVLKVDKRSPNCSVKASTQAWKANYSKEILKGILTGIQSPEIRVLQSRQSA